NEPGMYCFAALSGAPSSSSPKMGRSRSSGSLDCNGSHVGNRFDLGIGGFLWGWSDDVVKLKRLRPSSKSLGIGCDRRAEFVNVLMSWTSELISARYY